MRDALVRQIGDARDVELCGVVSENQKCELLSKAHLLLLPSVREGFARVIAEAMASGVPVVTTDVIDNGSKDVVEQFDIGVSVPPGVDSFVMGMEEALHCRDAYSANALRRVRELDWSIIAKRLLEFMSQGDEATPG
jgi:glycosyltransferase involved in cell wall biosynthesis